MSLMMLTNAATVIGVLITLLSTSIAAPTYAVSKAGGLGRRFDGIGGLSAGASSRLLADYDAVWYSQVMDYLFLPGFGAALHILKSRFSTQRSVVVNCSPSRTFFGMRIKKI